MSLADIGGGLGGFVGGWLGNGAASASQNASRQALLDALHTYQDKLNPQNLDTLLQQGQAGASNLNGAGLDSRGAQMDALSHLQNVYNTGGLTAQDKVAQEQATQFANQNARMQAGALRNELAARGQVGGGAELAGRLSSQQGLANAAHTAGSNAAASAQQRALDAMSQSGQLGGQIRGQDLARAQAQDQMAQFNAAQRSGAYAQNWNQRAEQAAGIAGAQNNLAGYYNQDAQRIRNQYAGMGKGAGASLGGLGDYFKVGQ